MAESQRHRPNLERFQAKWKPVRAKKTRQIKNPEPRFDSIETENALGWIAPQRNASNGISVVVVRRKIGNNGLYLAFLTRLEIRP
jgi:hypothetical protein